MERRKLQVNGVVQGVGFRPFIFRIARTHALTGYVNNTSRGVDIEIQGNRDAVSSFMEKLSEELPPLAEITSIEEAIIPPVPTETEFVIQHSEIQSEVSTFISPDMAVCNDCLSELFDVQDRRYLYPFINCTNCGPRYTIIRSIPYDRPATTMSPFTMCPECLREYQNPLDRRFHAQPNACPVCGPKVWIEEVSNRRRLEEKDDAINAATDALLRGKIVAVKGLGGFHLAVDATKPEAVNRLRTRKNREEKPLAIMVTNRHTLHEIVHVKKMEMQLLESPQHPIVLMEKKEQNPVSEAVAPGNSRLGVMLPYTPLHHILLERLNSRTATPILVMTSANLSEEPIVMTNEEAGQRLAGIADLLLLHDREILIRADDSVQSVISGKPVFMRRSRGYVPKPVILHHDGAEILATGGHLKNTVCLLHQNRAFLSQHTGDLENLEAYRFFSQSVSHLQNVLDLKPEIIAHDMHPGYFSTQWAREQGMKTIPVQHHHAHLASCLAEWRLDGPAIGIILDGTGYGYDAAIWGGEVLIGDYTEVSRFLSLAGTPLPGGDKAILEPWRTATAYLYTAFGENLPQLPFMDDLPVGAVIEMLQKHINVPHTSSCGRLFDAVAAICGIRNKIRYEAQAAIELMQFSEGGRGDILPYAFNENSIDITPMIRKIVHDIQNGIAVSTIGTNFHATLIRIFTEAAEKARKASRIDRVVLSGGVMQNEILFSGLMFHLSESGFDVYYQKQVPANDGGISLGQAVIARELVKKGMTTAGYNQTFQ